jgi:hypothetical protein
MGSRKKKLLVALAAVPVALLAGELVARAVHAATGSAYRAADARQQLLDTRSALLDRIPGLADADGRQDAGAQVVLGIHPYAGWDVVSSQIRTEAGRYASGQFDEPFEVLVIGGSVAALTASKGMGTLRGELRGDPRLQERQVVVLNHGRGSFKQPQMTMKMAYLLSLGYRPDAIVLIDGFNEVALGLDNVQLGANPLYPHWGMIGPIVTRGGSSPDRLRLYAAGYAIQDAIRAEIDRALEWRLYESAILGHWAQSRVNGMRARWTEVQDAIIASAGEAGGERHPARGEEGPSDPELVMDMITESWVESSIQLDAMCRAHGIAFLHVLQPTLHDEGSKPLTEREIEKGKAKPSWVQGVHLGYPRLRKASRRLVDAGVPFLDGSNTFAELEEETYYDSCHFRGVGMEMFAARIAGALLEQLP